MISIYYMENASKCIQSFGTITTGMFKTHMREREKNEMYTYKEQIWNCF